MTAAICPACGEQTAVAETRSDDFDPRATYTVVNCLDCDWDSEGGDE